MKDQPTLQSILEKAIQKEIQSQKLYVQLGKSARDEAARDALNKLAMQEEGHQHLLEQYLRGELQEGALCSNYPVDYKIAEKLEQPDISPDMNLKDVFTLAAKREKLSHELYTGLAARHPKGKVKALFQELASQELQHKQIMETLYTEVAFPQTDGG